jgi:hypothetical protein
MASFYVYYKLYMGVITITIANNIYIFKIRGGIVMKNKKNKNIEELTSEILGNAFIGNLFDISNDIDNTSQNLVTYLELDNIKNLSKEYKIDSKKK